MSYELKIECDDLIEEDLDNITREFLNDLTNEQIMNASLSVRNADVDEKGTLEEIGVIVIETISSIVLEKIFRVILSYFVRHPKFKVTVSWVNDKGVVVRETYSVKNLSDNNIQEKLNELRDLLSK